MTVKEAANALWLKATLGAEFAVHCDPLVLKEAREVMLTAFDQMETDAFGNDADEDGEELVRLHGLIADGETLEEGDAEELEKLTERWAV